MLAAGSNFELKLDTTPVNFEIKQAEQTITGDDFSARIGSTVDLSEKFNASGSLSYEITGANTTGSSVSGSTLTVGGTAGNFQLTAVPIFSELSASVSFPRSSASSW